MASKLKKLRRSVLLLSVIAFAAVFLVWRFLQENPTSSVSSTQEKKRLAARFELSDPSGQKIKLDDLKGNVVILHFWASWCPPCLDELPHWVELGTIFKGRPVKLVAVSEDTNWADAQKILPADKLPKNIVSLLDEGTKVSELYGTYQFPETYIISPDLNIAVKLVGSQDWGSKEVREFIEKLMP